MNMKLRMAVIATLLLTGCQALQTRNGANEPEQIAQQTAPDARSALDRSENEKARISVWRHASNEMAMDIPECNLLY